LHFHGICNKTTPSTPSGPFCGFIQNLTWNSVKLHLILNPVFTQRQREKVKEKRCHRLDRYHLSITAGSSSDL
jgi:hypothetical protein